MIPQDPSVRPFQIQVDSAVLADLQSRLRSTRWPDAELVGDWSQGAPLAWVQSICRYWAEGYDWSARQALLNQFAQFKTQIDGLDIHFIHQRSPHPGAMPLLITPRLAGLGGGVSKNHRAAHRPHCVWRPC